MSIDPIIRTKPETVIPRESEKNPKKHVYWDVFQKFQRDYLINPPRGKPRGIESRIVATG